MRKKVEIITCILDNIYIKGGNISMIKQKVLRKTFKGR